jgi:hypothetical protein
MPILATRIHGSTGLYIYMIQAEMRQCYERIRANAPELDKAGRQASSQVRVHRGPDALHRSRGRIGSLVAVENRPAGRAWYEAQIAAEVIDHRIRSELTLLLRIR